MAAMTSRSFVCFTVRFITLFTSFSLTISSPPSTEVKSLIHSLQNKYCGRQFCSSDPSQEAPFCTDEVVTLISVDPVTNFTFQVVEERHRQLDPPCFQCSCSDVCGLYGDCCADRHIDREYYFDCQKIARHVSGGIKQGFPLVVTKCLPDAPNYNENLAEKCEQGELGYISDRRLVESLHPTYNISVTFKNKYCAMCYNITNYTPWDVYISCDEDLISSNHTDINSLIRSMKESSVCIVSSDHARFQQPTLCSKYHGLISTCNVTGQWREYNETIEAACHYYLNPTSKYRNIFCALCNGMDREELMCPMYGIFWLDTWTRPMPFSARVNFDKSDVEFVKGGGSYPIRRIGKQERRQCREGDMFDAISEKCREIYCSLATHSDNTTCAKAVPTEAYVVTSWMLTAYYTDDIIVPYGGPSPNVGGSVIHALRGTLANWGFALSSSSLNDYASIHSTHNLIVKKSKLEVELLLLPGSRLQTSRQQLVDIKNITVNITWLGENKMIHVVSGSEPKDISNMLILPGPGPVGIHDIDLGKTVNVPLTFNVSCPMVRFESHEVLALNNTIIIHRDTVLDDTEYFVTGRNDYLICVDDVFQGDRSLGSVSDDSRPSADFHIEQLVTVICFSCSLVFLMLTMLVYISIRQLHTVPGLNLILLTFSLFMAQALYFVGAEAGSITTRTVCTVIGVLIHYFWLVSLSWLNVCSVHMVRTVTGIFTSPDFVDGKKYVFLKYSAFAFVAPLLVVGIAISTSYITSGYTSFGYGDSLLCFDLSSFISVLSLGIPAGIMTLISTMAFTFTMVFTLRAKNEKSSKGKSGTGDIVKFFELSTITGLSWLFGFLGYFFKRVELVYVFSVLMAVHGVFIFLSFVTARPVLKLLKEKLCCVREHGNAMKHDDTIREGVESLETMSPKHI